jgi:hypothetical protein
LKEQTFETVNLKKERKGVGVISWEWLYNRKLEKEISKLTLVEMKTS